MPPTQSLPQTSSSRSVDPFKLTRSIGITSSHKRFVITPEVSAEDYTLFARNPTTLPDKQFILEKEEGRESLFEVTEARFCKGSWTYGVRFEGCTYSIRVTDNEMMDLLKKSILVG